MSGAIKTLMYGSEEECSTAAEMIKSLPDLAGYECEHLWVYDLEEYEKALVDFAPTLLVVLADGAEGMECVYRTKERRPSLPVFWFSDDKDFAVQSYRLNCAYFSIKPPTVDTMENAVRRCRHMGIQI